LTHDLDLDLDGVTSKERAKYLGHMLFSPKVVVRVHTHTHAHTRTRTHTHTHTH